MDDQGSVKKSKKITPEMRNILMTLCAFFLASVPYIAYAHLIKTKNNPSENTISALVIIAGIATAITMLLIMYSDSKTVQGLCIALSVFILILHISIFMVTDRTQTQGHVIAGLVGGSVTAFILFGYSGVKYYGYDTIKKISGSSGESED